MSKDSALMLLSQIDTTGGLIVRGYQSLQTVREAIQLAVREAGYQITFDPGSAPELVDYLLVAGPQGIEKAAQGALLGALVGLLFDNPKLGATIGAGLGAAKGLQEGIQKVEHGWRIRAIHDEYRNPVITIDAVR
ncbi:DUF1269 domain-containing protein [Myxococcus sp. SDU36]|uniref:DUF1269 domain-containing protein n=1 Tax=Myxococcus sp. SDU36 TaxID=2831967 RepID=UPI00254365DC|nr:DUF1269 domain-containing protein [Myxococcus sp. SDU36]WIG97982.1 DUF1269 domain-containing protein [Myxococcus sp. SDU36]